MNDTTSHDIVMKSMDPKGSWDWCGYWDLGSGSFLAFVADAPALALQNTGRLVEGYLEQQAPMIRERVAELPPELVSLLAADLMSGINAHLLAQGGGRAYGACSLALVHRESLHVVSAGDCAVYVIGDAMVRHSETTRLSGGSAFVMPSSAPRETVATGNHSVVGGAVRFFNPSDVLRLPTTGMRALALVSDGAEVQLGPDRMLKLFSACDPGGVVEEINAKLKDGLLKDDVTVLIARVQGVSPESRQLHQDLHAQKKGLASLKRDLNQARRQVDALSDIFTQNTSSFHQRLVHLEKYLNSAGLLGEDVGRLKAAMEEHTRRAGLQFQESDKSLKTVSHTVHDLLDQFRRFDINRSNWENNINFCSQEIGRLEQTIARCHARLVSLEQGIKSREPGKDDQPGTFYPSKANSPPSPAGSVGFKQEAIDPCSDQTPRDQVPRPFATGDTELAFAASVNRRQPPDNVPPIRGGRLSSVNWGKLLRWAVICSGAIIAVFLTVWDRGFERVVPAAKYNTAHIPQGPSARDAVAALLSGGKILGVPAIHMVYIPANSSAEEAPLLVVVATEKAFMEVMSTGDFSMGDYRQELHIPLSLAKEHWGVLVDKLELTQEYSLKEGEVLVDVAKRFVISVDNLKKMNESGIYRDGKLVILPGWEKLRPGDILRVPTMHYEVRLSGDLTTRIVAKAFKVDESTIKRFDTIKEDGSGILRIPFLDEKGMDLGVVSKVSPEPGETPEDFCVRQVCTFDDVQQLNRRVDPFDR